MARSAVRKRGGSTLASVLIVLVLLLAVLAAWRVFAGRAAEGAGELASAVELPSAPSVPTMPDAPLVPKPQ